MRRHRNGTKGKNKKGETHKNDSVAQWGEKRDTMAQIGTQEREGHWDGHPQRQYEDEEKAAGSRSKREGGMPGKRDDLKKAKKTDAENDDTIFHSLSPHCVPAFPLVCGSFPSPIQFTAPIPRHIRHHPRHFHNPPTAHFPIHPRHFALMHLTLYAPIPPFNLHSLPFPPPPLLILPLCLRLSVHICTFTRLAPPPRLAPIRPHIFAFPSSPFPSLSPLILHFFLHLPPTSHHHHQDYVAFSYKK